MEGVRSAVYGREGGGGIQGCFHDVKALSIALTSLNKQKRKVKKKKDEEETKQYLNQGSQQQQ